MLCDVFCAWATTPPHAKLTGIGMGAHMLCSDFTQNFSSFCCLPPWNFPLVTLWLKFHWVSFCRIDSMPCFTHGADNIWCLRLILRASQVVKDPPANVGDSGFNPRIRKIPWRRKWQSTLVFLLGQSHEQKSLEGYSPQGHKESDTTEGLSMHTGSL